MSIRMSRYIGYGMPLETFEKVTLIKNVDDYDWFSVIEDHLDANRAAFTYTDEEWSEYFGKAFVYNRNLLAKRFQEPEEHKPSDLFRMPDIWEEENHVLFFPSGLQVEQWTHWDDDVDYAFELWRNGDDIDALRKTEMRSFVKYVADGHYPYTKSLTGRLVPFELEFWLKKAGVFDDAGIAEIRPMIAQTWG